MYAELHPEADREFTAHAYFYERQEPGLGYRFIYRIELERIWIVAVAHQKRRPGYWRERIE